MNKVLVVLAVFGALALAASPALAVPAIVGPNWSAHFTDGSSDYVGGVPRAPFGTTPAGFAPTTVAVGDENRSIFNVDTFLHGGTPYGFIPAGQITGLVYDLKLDAVSGDPVAGTATLYYTALGRNPITNTNGAPVGSGGVMEIYDHTSGTGTLDPIYNPNSDGLGPQAWVPDGDLTGTPNHAVAADGYPNVDGNAAALASGASLWLQGVFVPIGLDPNGNATLLEETINLADPSGPNGTSFLAYLHLTGGSGEYSFVHDFFGPGKDISLADTFALPGNAGYDGGPVAAGSWQIESSDPARGAPSPIPEPATMTLLGFGIAGLVVRIRRK